MVSARSLRRAIHRNPAAIKVAAGVLAGAVGMTTAAYGVFHIVQPYKGNGVRSEDTAQQEEQAPTATDSLVLAALDIVLAELPSSDSFVDEAHLFDLSDELVVSILNGTQPPVNGTTPGTGGGTGDGGNGGNGGGLLPWGGGTINPPGGGSGGGDGTGGKDATVPSVGLGPAVGALPTLSVPNPGCAIAPAAPAVGVGGPAPAEQPSEEPPADGTEQPPADAPAEGETPAEDPCAPATVQAPQFD